jgi:hypothetical protein
MARLPAGRAERSLRCMTALQPVHGGRAKSPQFRRARPMPERHAPPVSLLCIRHFAFAALFAPHNAYIHRINGLPHSIARRPLRVKQRMEMCHDPSFPYFRLAPPFEPDHRLRAPAPQPHHAWRDRRPRRIALRLRRELTGPTETDTPERTCQAAPIEAPLSFLIASTQGVDISRFV